MIRTFWSWLFLRGSHGHRGISNVANWYVALHVVIAVALIALVREDPFEVASKALFPAASILIGASLAWTTRASALLQNKEFTAGLFNEERPSEDYIYSFQLSFLIIISMLVYVAIMAGGGLAVRVFSPTIDVQISGFWLYFLLSIAVRECWGVVNFTNMLNLLNDRRSR